jgi:hypothetical protein
MAQKPGREKRPRQEIDQIPLQGPLGQANGAYGRLKAHLRCSFLKNAGTRPKNDAGRLSLGQKELMLRHRILVKRHRHG